MNFILLVYFSVLLLSFSNSVSDGTLLKFTDKSDSKQLYLFLNKTLFPVSSHETILLLGFDLKDIVKTQQLLLTRLENEVRMKQFIIDDIKQKHVQTINLLD